MKKQVYISGALTNSNRKPFYEKIGKTVEECGYKPYIPHLHTDPEKNPDATNGEVYEVDMEEVDKSAFIVAFVGYPSLGTGAELEHANANLIPIFLLYPKGEKVSRLILGMPRVQISIEYEAEEEALMKLAQAIQTIHF